MPRCRISDYYQLKTKIVYKSFDPIENYIRANFSGTKFLTDIQILESDVSVVLDDLVHFQKEIFQKEIFEPEILRLLRK